MNKEQLYAAQTAMIEWLSDPHELGNDSGNLKITNLDRLIFTKNGEFTI